MAAVRSRSGKASRKRPGLRLVISRCFAVLRTQACLLGAFLLASGLPSHALAAGPRPTATALPGAAAAPAAMGKPRAVTRAPHVAERPPTKEGIDFFENRIRPILVHSCYECHSGDPAKAKGHLVLDTHDGLRRGGDSGAPVVVGHADDSLLVEAIRYEGLEMPPKGKLPDEVIEDFVAWIEMGAPDPRSGKAANPKNKVDLAEAKRYWAFQPAKIRPAPALNDKGWSFVPLDDLVRAHQEQAGLSPVADADRTTLIRRLTFDLTGLPPTPEEIDAFVADKSGGALEYVVDRLLASPRFGERWGRHWLDVVRYGESTGKDRNLPYRYAWRYRDYVIESFNQGKPFDRFIVEQLAGDLLPAKDAAEHDRLLVATGFLAIGPKGVNVKQPEQFEMDQIDDQIDVTTRALLGLTVACARCHDHKFDPIPTNDYYALAGIFHSTETYSGIAPGKKTGNDRRLLALNVAATQQTATPQQLEEQKSREQEIGRLEGRIDAIKAAQKQSRQAQKRNRRGRQQPQQNPYVAPIDPKKTRQQIKEVQERLDKLESVPLVGELAMGVREAGAPANCRLLERGELDKRGPEVPRGVLTVLKTQQSAQIPPRHSGRLELAHWIASRDNPLTARVMVNRVWEHLLGQGLVDTVDNFGALGNEPSNPELLDLLAVQFMKDNWSVKKLIRSIVLSRTYRLSSAHDEANFLRDPANRLLWRVEPRRLDAEEIRDAMLSASGQLDLTPPTGSPMLELDNAQVTGVKKMQAGNRRSVYLPVPRGAVPDTLQVFDMADPNLIFGKRDVTTVPTQALYLMNNPFVLRQAEQMARRVLNQPQLDQPARIAWAYRVAIGRPPTPSESGKVRQFLNDYHKSLDAVEKKGNPQVAAWTCFCQTLFAVGEFRYVY
jgi:hypothetical protein